MKLRGVFFVGLVQLGLVPVALAVAPSGYYPTPENHDAVTFRAALSDAISSGDTLPYSSTKFDTHDAINILDSAGELDGFVNLIYSGSRASMDSWPGYNREHVWPQSMGAGPGSDAHTDLHHIFACDANVNSARGNQQFGECDTDDCGFHVEAPDALYDGDTFEPPASLKGDIARTLMYMDVRYEGKNGEPNLVLQEEPGEVGCDCMGELSTLLEWHFIDPVDARELQRNDEIFAIQGNRNPFVDNPEWVSVLFLANEAPTEPVIESAFPRPIAWKDGSVTERYAGQDVGAIVETRSIGVSVGDSVMDQDVRGFLAYSVNNIPAEAEIVGATLHLTPVVVSGEPEKLGPITVEIARGHFGATPELEPEDFEDTFGVQMAGVIPADYTIGETRAIQIEKTALRYIRSGASVQFRLQSEVATDGNNNRDQVSFGSGDHNNMLMRPLLEVHYVLPQGN